MRILLKVHCKSEAVHKVILSVKYHLLRSCKYLIVLNYGNVFYSETVVVLVLSLVLVKMENIS